MKQQHITHTNKVLDFGEFLKYSKKFVETGTCHGRTVQVAIDKGYTDIRSVEVYEPFYQKCMDRFFGKENGGAIVSLWKGKSTEWLPAMLGDETERAVIFLDAHPTGPDTGGHDDLMEKGDKSEFHQDSILKAELEIILNHRKDHIIIIDDQNGFNDISEAHINQVFAANPEYSFFFYDEGEGEHFYKNKCVVCIPN